MAKIAEILKVAGSLENAERMAREKGPDYLLDLMLILGLQGKFDEAKKIGKEVLKINPNDVRAAFNYGWYRMQEGKLLEGFNLMNRGRFAGIWGNAHIGTRKPIWNGEELGNKYVLFACEAGIGDEILFVRFVNDIAERGGKVIVACSEGLMSLFSRMVNISAVVHYNSANSVYHDYWIPSMGTPVVLKYEYKDLNGKPYLTPLDSAVEKFKVVINSNKKKVGICWKGNPKYEHEQFRKFPEGLFFHAVEQKHLKVYSLQKGAGEKVPSFITNLEPLLETWEDTAGAIANLDLVISSCTAIAHLATAMGKPTWIVIPILPYWSWALPGETSPWYSSVRLFRQKKFGLWEEPFREINKELK